MGAIVDMAKSTLCIIENIGDSKTDKELSDKLGNIQVELQNKKNRI